MSKTGRYTYECSFPPLVPWITARTDRPPTEKRNEDVVPTLLRWRDNVPHSQRTIRVIWVDQTSDAAPPSEYADLLTEVVPNTQSLHVAVPTNEVLLITINIELRRYMSLRALFDFVPSKNVARRRSIDDIGLKLVKRDTLKQGDGNLATEASVIVIEHVVGLRFSC